MRNQAPPRDSAAADVFQALIASGCGPRDLEQSVELLRQSYELLERAERRIELLSGVDVEGNPITQPFDDSATHDPSAPGKSVHALLVPYTSSGLQLTLSLLKRIPVTPLLSLALSVKSTLSVGGYRSPSMAIVPVGGVLSIA